MRVTKLNVETLGNELEYVAEAIEDSGKYYYRVGGITIGITKSQYDNVISNPCLYYFSTALKLDRLIGKVLEAYYHNEFLSDLRRFMPMSDLPYFGHNWHSDCSGLDAMPPEKRVRFLICLYFTVLADQGMHAHFRPLHAKFERLTRYPKFCHGLGQFQKNPRQILDVPVERGFVSSEQLHGLIRSGMDLFVEEIINFSERHMPELTPQIFFEKLIHDSDVQIPLLVTMVDPTIKETPAWKACDALRKSVMARWPKTGSPDHIENTFR